VTALLEDIIKEVISSNQKKPSIPGVILETIIDMVNGVIDIEATLPSKQLPAVSSDVLESVALSIVTDIVDEVIQSNNRQPSVPGVVLQLITEMITNSDSNNNQERKATKTTAATQDGVIKQQNQKTGDEKKKLAPSESQKQKEAAHSDPTRMVCSFCLENKINSKLENAHSGSHQSCKKHFGSPNIGQVLLFMTVIYSNFFLFVFLFCYAMVGCPSSLRTPFFL